MANDACFGDSILNFPWMFSQPILRWRNYKINGVVIFGKYFKIVPSTKIPTLLYDRLNTVTTA